MLDRITNLISGNYNHKQIAKLQGQIDKINAIYTDLDTVSDTDIKAKTEELKKRYADGSSLDDLLPEAFAVVKQACKRMFGQSFAVKGEMVEWNMIPYDVQLVWAIVLHQGKIAEMKTGEGKTLVAALPTYLNALTGQGVHVVTVNDYLASRDAERMWHLYRWLGLTVGCVVKTVPIQDRKEHYACDITYVENSELGFDYLRDNLVKAHSERNLLRRPLQFAIVDEVDSILIDEARTPLIISRPAEEATDKYVYYAKIAKTLIPAKWTKKVSKWFLHEWLNEDEKKKATDNKTDTESEDQSGDYYIDIKLKTASLSSGGIAKLEQMLWVENLYRDLGYQEIHHIENALKAASCYIKDKDYILKDGEVMIVDQNTGRAMSGRRFSQGLHQAIEAKENVQIQRESKTMATITYQNFFRQYKKLAGMTGTATTEWEEFEKIYSLEVLAIPTHKNVIRVDKGDKVYFSQKAKWDHALEYITFAHQMGQPILIGTSSIETSEYVAQLLNKKNIIHSVLNAKYHESEAKIVANAGKSGSVVVATNMAWRGTDIKLEKGLNQTLAKNYASWIRKQVTGSEPQSVSATVYSTLEAEKTIDALVQEFALSDEQVRQAEKWWVTANAIKLRLIYNSKKKENEQALLEIKVEPANSSPDYIEKDFHYGLMILATEKHDSRRIDNQLRWRAGRQWDPGVSTFIVALDDDIMKKVWGEKIKSMASMLLSKKDLEEMELTQKQFTSSIRRAQKQMEARHFSVRKHLFDYDSVVDKQRQKIYAQRDMMLDALEKAEHSASDMNARTEDADSKTSSPVLQEIQSLIPEVITTTINNYMILQTPFHELEEILQKEFQVWLSASEIEKLHDKEQLVTTIVSHVSEKLQNASNKLPSAVLNRVLATTYLNVIDRYRVDHIDAMQYLRDKVWLMSYAQQDPLVVYKKEAYEKFEALLNNIHRDTIINVANIDRDQLQERITILEQQKQQEESKLIDKLKSIATVVQPRDTQKQASPTRMTYQDEDGIEIIDTSDVPVQVEPETIDFSQRKLRPNDKVIVRYPDGRVEYDVKYKKIKEEYEAWKLEIIG